MTHVSLSNQSHISQPTVCELNGKYDKYLGIYPSRRHNSPPTLEIIIRNFPNISQNFLKFPKIFNIFQIFPKCMNLREEYHAAEVIPADRIHQRWPPLSHLSLFFTSAIFTDASFPIFAAFIFILPMHRSHVSYLTHTFSLYSRSFKFFRLSALPNSQLWINPI